MKECVKCNTLLPLTNFYTCYGYPRGECKDCFKSQVKQTTKLKKSIKNLLSISRPKEYMESYYQRNKEKFRENSKNFKQRNPHYFKDYYRQRKQIPVKNVA